MAGEEAKTVENPEEEELFNDSDSMMGMLQEWIRTQAPWWATSFTIHMVGLSTLLLFGRFAANVVNNESGGRPRMIASMACWMSSGRGSAAGAMRALLIL